MSIYDIAIPRHSSLPAGYRSGAHTTHPGSEGWHIVRESDGATCHAQLRPDLDEPVTAEQLDEAIAAAARETVECDAIAARLEERARESLTEEA